EASKDDDGVPDKLRLELRFKAIKVKDKQENDEIETKPDKNGKRGKARQWPRLEIEERPEG
nr:hypothetical protein [Tanacetum cinerariifolium]